jgi:hypothetical protein
MHFTLEGEPHMHGFVIFNIDCRWEVSGQSLLFLLSRVKPSSRIKDFWRGVCLSRNPGLKETYDLGLWSNLDPQLINYNLNKFFGHPFHCNAALRNFPLKSYNGHQLHLFSKILFFKDTFILAEIIWMNKNGFLSWKRITKPFQKKFVLCVVSTP